MVLFLVKMVPHRAMNTQRTLCIIKGFFVSRESDGECVVDGSIQNLVEKDFIQHQKGFFYCNKLDIVQNIYNRRTVFGAILYHSEEPFHDANNPLITQKVLYRTIFFTKEPLKNHFFSLCSNNLQDLSNHLAITQQ